ncbi:helix-turn-helix domain-containing protein [Brevibacillus choshinensis]|uniref:Helix-turn-helix domain-containing protein n=1 Tax=Brevibacillus choshinensis TaxID=54911 RepID=A0ABX7FW43_BRECH|nr:AraC family transcriptional regulator [Brevibacillus choshinensis]QRG70065.1 helix-turn-helix domain-containing protein [Brevibacillus choshinensis]
MGTYMEKAAHDWTDDSVRIIATPSMAAKSTYYYVQEVGHFRTLPTYFTERQHLNSFLIVYTLAGKGYLHYQGTTHELLPHHVFFIDCQEYQHYRTDKADLWEIAWVHFNGSSSRGYYEQFAKNGCPVISVGENSPIPGILAQLLLTNRQNDVRTEPLSSKHLVDLLTELLLVTNPREAAGSFLPAHIQRIVSELDKRFAEKMSLDQLASEHAMSKYHLLREYKKYTGYTPNEYLIHRRITYAKELLTYSEWTVAQIANQIGMDNVSHFINLFKQRVEMTPLAYRKKWQRIT